MNDEDTPAAGAQKLRLLGDAQLTQAVRVVATLGVADHIGDEPVGCERSRAEFVGLAEAAGLSIVGRIPLSPPYLLLEAAPVAGPA